MTSDVIGVVYPPGAGGDNFLGTSNWTLRFALKPWRDGSGKIVESLLNVAKVVDHDELKQSMARLLSYKIVHLRVRFEPTDAARADLIRVVSWDVSDPDLQRLADAMQAPRTFHDEQLGTFTFDRSVSWWAATIEWCGAQVRLAVGGDEAGASPDALRTARSLWNRREEWQGRIADFAVSRLLEPKNGDWLGEDELPLSADEFKKRMTLQTIVAFDGGQFEFLHDDGDLFWGHSIQVVGSLEGGLAEADIVG